MQIRSAQFEKFQQTTEAAFVEELLQWARQHLTVWVKYDSDDILRERIKSGIARARSHGFEWQSSLAKFVALMLRFSPDFDRHPAAEAVLQRNDVLPEARADMLFTEVTAEQWAEIEENYEPTGWQQFATGPVL